MEKKQKTSLTWQLILTMVVIVAGTVAMCWFFNTTFLEKYYMFHKEKELKSSFDQVRLICEKQGDSSDDAYVQFERICANGNINMLIADQDRNGVPTAVHSVFRCRWRTGCMEVTAAVCRCFHPERIIRCFGRPMNGCSRSIWFFWEL